MTKWREVQLKELINISHGYAFSGENITDVDNNIVLVTPGNFNIGGGFKNTGKKFFNGKIPKDYILNKNDIIVTMTDLSKKADTLGYSALVPNDNKIYLHNQRIGLVKIKSNQINKKYLYWLLRTPWYQRRIANTSSGTNVKHTSPKRIYLYKFLLPNLETQKKIGNVLSTYDNLIENNKKRIELLEKTVQEIYKEWFVRMRFPGHENTKFVKGIPEGWEVKKIGNIIKKLESGKRTKNNNKEDKMIVSLGAGDIKGLGEYDNTSEFLIPYRFFMKLKRGIIENKDIAIYKDGAYTGKTTMFRDNFPYKEISVNEHVFLVRCKKENMQNYLLFTLMQDSYFQLMQALSMTSAQPGLNQSKFKNIKVEIPNKNLIDKFNNLSELFLKNIFNLAKQNQNLIKQRDLLLPRLMNGTIEVR